MLDQLIDNSKIVDGKTIGDHRQFYTVNVKYLGTLTHEQFCAEFPNAAAEMQRIHEMQERLAALLAPARVVPETQP